MVHTAAGRRSIPVHHLCFSKARSIRDRYRALLEGAPEDGEIAKLWEGLSGGTLNVYGRLLTQILVGIPKGTKPRDRILFLQELEGRCSRGKPSEHALRHWVDWRYSGPCPEWWALTFYRFVLQDTSLEPIPTQWPPKETIKKISTSSSADHTTLSGSTLSSGFSSECRKARAKKCCL